MSVCMHGLNNWCMCVRVRAACEAYGVYGACWLPRCFCYVSAAPFVQPSNCSKLLQPPSLVHYRPLILQDGERKERSLQMIARMSNISKCFRISGQWTDSLI